MRIARVVNLVSAIETLKKEGLWIAGADMAGNSMYEADMKGGFALVIGSEGSGLSKLVKEKCDFLVSVPIKARLILLMHRLRQLSSCLKRTDRTA